MKCKYNMQDPTFFFYNENEEKLIRRYSDADKFSVKLKEDDFLLFIKALNSFKKFRVSLWDSSLLFSNLPEKQAIAYIPLDFLEMKEIRGTNGTVQLFGISLSNKRWTEELFTDDKDTFERWFLLLKRFCLQPKFGTDFEVTRFMANGLNSKIFQAVRNGSQDTVSVKIFDKRLIMNKLLDYTLARNEIAIMRVLEHPQTLRLLDLYEGDNFVYCVSESCNGISLFELVKQNHRLSESFALREIRMVLEGLAFLHERTIVHRGLKLENVYFRGKSLDSELCLVDFSLAAFEKDTQRLIPRCGTPGYLAPELLLGQPYGPKLDVFSAGVMLYIMLTGHEPFEANSEEELLEKNKRCKIDFDFSRANLNLKPTTKDLLKRMLEADPAKRLDSKNCLNHVAFSQLDDLSEKAYIQTVISTRLPLLSSRSSYLELATTAARTTPNIWY